MSETSESQQRPIKILLITARSDVGGGPKHLWDLLNGLQAQQASNFMFFMACPAVPPYYQKFKNVVQDLIIIPQRKFTPIHLWRLWNFCRLNQVDLIHSHGRGAGIYGRLLALTGIAVNLHTFHGVHQPHTLLEHLKIYLDRRLVFATTKFICVAQQEKQQALRLKIARTRDTAVVHNGVKIWEIKQQIISRTQARTQFNLPADAIILGALNRFDPIKGNALLIQAFVHYLRTQQPPPSLARRPLILVIAGDGEDWALCHKLVQTENMQEKIKLIGPTTQPIEFLSAIDVMVSFALSEAFPLAVLEALICNRPLILSDIPAHREIMALAQTPALFLQPSSHAITAKIINQAITDHVPNTQNAREYPQLDHQLGAQAIQQIYEEVFLRCCRKKSDNNREQ